MVSLLLALVLTQTPEVRAEARTRFETGEAFFRDRRYAEALVSFEASYRALPLGATAWNLGRTAQALGDAPRAIGWFRRYLRLEPRAADRASTEAALRHLESSLARQRVQAVTVFVEPVEALVTVDQVHGGADGYTLALPPGTHMVQVVAPGYVAKEVSVVVDLARSQELDVRLAVPAPSAPPAPLAANPLPPDGPLASAPAPLLVPVGTPAPTPVEVTRARPAPPLKEPRFPVLRWVATGAAVVAVGAALACGGVAQGQSNTLRDGTVRPTEAADVLVGDVRLFSTLSNVAWGATAVTAGLAGYTWVAE